MVAAALLASASSLGSSALSFYGGLKANSDNYDLAKEQMAFQERMSNTAHQREVKDLRKAGLNPILSAGGSGSSSPVGSSAQMVNPARDIDLSSAVDKYYDTKQKSITNDVLIAQEKKARWDVYNTKITGELIEEQIEKTKQETISEMTNQLVNSAQTKKIIQDTANSVLLTPAQIREMNANTSFQRERARGFSSSDSVSRQGGLNGNATLGKGYLKRNFGGGINYGQSKTHSRSW